MIDRSAASSKCPYCGTAAEHKGLAIIFEDKDQNKVRSVLTGMNPIDIPDKRKYGEDPDPLSTLIHRYETTKDVQKKMIILSRGLSDIYDIFTLADVERVDEKNAERVLKAMLEHGYVHEVSHGKYRA